jgi:hypothetical protein
MVAGRHALARQATAAGLACMIDGEDNAGVGLSQENCDAMSHVEVAVR